MISNNSQLNKASQMKNFFLAVAMIFACASATLAQTDNATLNVVLSDIKSITVNAGQKTVNLPFTTISNYQNGVTLVQDAHLAIQSTGKFKVYVKASSDNISGTNGGSIDANTINVTAVKDGGDNIADLQYYNGGTRSLSATKQDLFGSSQSGTLNTTFKVTYIAGQNSAYLNKPAGTYTTTVTYSIEAN